MPMVRTIALRTEVEIPKVKGSRFVGWAVPVADEAEAAQVVSELKEAHATASHHAYAWRFGPDRTRAWDDGEPRGTAGEPLLRRLNGLELVGVLLVAARWFGGTKLGMGGLVRAYGEAGAAALDAAEIVERVVVSTVRLVASWSDDGTVTSVLKRSGLPEGTPTYADGVERRVEVPVEQVNELIQEISERTAGRVIGEVIG